MIERRPALGKGLSALIPDVPEPSRQGAIEVDVDALCDGTNVHVAGVMEHIEEAGVHSGDSACALPPCRSSAALLTTPRRGVVRRHPHGP